MFRRRRSNERDVWNTGRRPAFPAPILAVLTLCVLVLPAIATANHEETSGNDIEEVGFEPLGNKGFNTDIVSWVSQDEGLFAAAGTNGRTSESRLTL